MLLYLSADGQPKREDVSADAEKTMKSLGYSAGITTSQRKVNEKGPDGVTFAGFSPDSVGGGDAAQAAVSSPASRGAALAFS